MANEYVHQTPVYYKYCLRHVQRNADVCSTESGLISIPELDIGHS